MQESIRSRGYYGAGEGRRMEAKELGRIHKNVAGSRLLLVCIGVDVVAAGGGVGGVGGSVGGEPLVK